MRYYRSQLSTEHQKAYDIIEESIQNFKTPITLPKLSSKAFNKILSAVSADHPEFFYWHNRSELYYEFPDRLEYQIAYDFSKEDAIPILKKTEEIADKLLSRAKKANCKTHLQITAFIHDYITDNISYTKGERTPKRNHCIIGPLINRECVCEGYAKLFMYILSRANIPIIYVSGKTDPKSDTGHAWNMIRIEGNWYHTDITWNSNEKGTNGEWTYFMLSEKEITEKDHYLPGDFTLPSSTHSMNLNRDERRIA